MFVANCAITKSPALQPPGMVCAIGDVVYALETSEDWYAGAAVAKSGATDKARNRNKASTLLMGLT